MKSVQIFLLMYPSTDHFILILNDFTLAIEVAECCQDFEEHISLN